MGWFEVIIFEGISESCAIDDQERRVKMATGYNRVEESGTCQLFAMPTK